MTIILITGLENSIELRVGYTRLDLSPSELEKIVRYGDMFLVKRKQQMRFEMLEDEDGAPYPEEVQDAFRIRITELENDARFWREQAQNDPEDDY